MRAAWLLGPTSQLVGQLIAILGSPREAVGGQEISTAPDGGGQRRARLPPAHSADDLGDDGVPLPLTDPGVDPGVGEDDHPALEQGKKYQDTRARARVEHLLLDEGGNGPLVNPMFNGMSGDEPEPKTGPGHREGVPDGRAPRGQSGNPQCRRLRSAEADVEQGSDESSSQGAEGCAGPGPLGI